jgi:hypothetical protein
MADWYPTTGSDSDRTAHRHDTRQDQPPSASGSAPCGARYLFDSNSHPDLHVLGDDGSVLWCTTCFPDAAPPGRSDGAVR